MLNLNLQTDTENHLNKIRALFNNDEQFAQHIISTQTNELKKALLSLRLDLQQLEQQYQMSSDIFYQKFQAGELNDHEDFILWSGIYELQLNQEQQLNELLNA